MALQRRRARGGTVTLNLYDPHGHLLDYRRVEELAGAENISLRTGCFCNPGAGETAEGLTEEDMRAGFTMGAEINLLSFVRMMQERGHKSAGAIRASIGIATNFADVWRFLAVRCKLPRSDAAHDWRRQLRHRILPHHSRWKLASSGTGFSLWGFEALQGLKFAQPEAHAT